MNFSKIFFILFFFFNICNFESILYSKSLIIKKKFISNTDLYNISLLKKGNDKHLVIFNNNQTKSDISNTKISLISINYHPSNKSVSYLAVISNHLSNNTFINGRYISEDKYTKNKDIFYLGILENRLLMNFYHSNNFNQTKDHTFYLVLKEPFDVLFLDVKDITSGFVNIGQYTKSLESGFFHKHIISNRNSSTILLRPTTRVTGGILSNPFRAYGYYFIFKHRIVGLCSLFEKKSNQVYIVKKTPNYVQEKIKQISLGLILHLYHVNSYKKFNNH